jgi:hypothetical protein
LCDFKSSLFFRRSALTLGFVGVLHFSYTRGVSKKNLQ